MHFMDWTGGGWFMMGFWWILVIVGITFLIKWLVDSRSGFGVGESAVDVLKKRYARGEISREEFEEKKKAIV